MSGAWETTQDDVKTVLDRHGVTVTDERLSELHDGLDHEGIEDGLLHYTNMDDQTNSMLSDIEDALMEDGVIPKGDKLFNDTDSGEVESDDLDDEDEDA